MKSKGVDKSKTIVEGKTVRKGKSGGRDYMQYLCGDNSIRPAKHQIL